MDYDIHVYWADADQRKEAAAIKNMLTGLNIHTFEMIDKPIGPHPLPMFEAHVNDNDLVTVEQEIEKIRKLCSVLIHEKTGNPMYDHTYGVRWLGKTLTLDIGFIARIMGHRF